MVKNTLKSLLKKIGLELRRVQKTTPPVLATQLARHSVDCIFDVGANCGQSIGYFRALDYSGKIVSFEPISHLYSQLEQRVTEDSNGVSEKCAIGDSDGMISINVSGGHGGASSILSMSERLRAAAPDQAITHIEKVAMHTVDWAVEKYYPSGDRLFLKLDVQGYEKQCLLGAKNSLNRIVGIKAEFSLVKNYEGEPLLYEIIPMLYGYGYYPVSIEEGWSNTQTGELYQVDVCFFRRE